MWSSLLTNASVAEVAKRPLYKVSCGDIGTTVEKVEEVSHTTSIFLDTVDRRSILPQYSSSAGYGSVVGCFVYSWMDIVSHCRNSVVLLDEADVFLEQRSLQQLERNALVSGKCTKPHLGISC